MSVCVSVTLATAVLHFWRTSSGFLKDFCRTSEELLKDFWRTSKGLLKDFRLNSLQNLHKSQPPGLQDLLNVAAIHEVQYNTTNLLTYDCKKDCILEWWPFYQEQGESSYEVGITEDEQWWRPSSWLHLKILLLLLLTSFLHVFAVNKIFFLAETLTLASWNVRVSQQSPPSLHDAELWQNKNWSRTISWFLVA